MQKGTSPLDVGIRKVSEGQPARIGPFGDCLRGKVRNGCPVSLLPFNRQDCHPGQVVLARISSGVVMYALKSMADGSFLIGDCSGRTETRVTADAILGRVVIEEADRAEPHATDAKNKAASKSTRGRTRRRT
jgi:hypothetical protein